MILEWSAALWLKRCGCKASGLEGGPWALHEMQADVCGVSLTRKQFRLLRACGVPLLMTSPQQYLQAFLDSRF